MDIIKPRFRAGSLYDIGISLLFHKWSASPRVGFRGMGQAA